MVTKATDSCLAKAKPDEPLFVLRGQDASAPLVILSWIELNFETTPDEKLREAFEQALTMKHYPARKCAD